MFYHKFLAKLRDWVSNLHIALKHNKHHQSRLRCIISGRLGILKSKPLAIWYRTLCFQYQTNVIPESGGILSFSLQWRHNGCDGVSNHRPHDCLLNCLFRRRSKKTSKLRVTGLCEGNSPVAGELTTKRASNAESVSIWWRHRVTLVLCQPDARGCWN